MITCMFENGGKAQLRHVVVHMIVEKDGCLLLEKRDGPILESGKWSLPGGFLERGETAAQCALRELKEETGWVGEKDWESSKVEWIPFDKLLAFEEYAFDHGETIRQYVEYRKKKFPLPILI